MKTRHSRTLSACVRKSTKHSIPILEEQHLLHPAVPESQFVTICLLLTAIDFSVHTKYPAIIAKICWKIQTLASIKQYHVTRLGMLHSSAFDLLSMSGLSCSSYIDPYSVHQGSDKYVMAWPLHPIQRIAISNLSTFWCHSAEYVQGLMFDPSMAGDQKFYTATKHMKKVQNNANTDKDILPQ